MLRLHRDKLFKVSVLPVRTFLVNPFDFVIQHFLFLSEPPQLTHGSVTRIQDNGSEEEPLHHVTLRGVQELLGLADTDSHVLRGGGSSLQRQLRGQRR